jgi:hypothetical protein
VPVTSFCEYADTKPRKTPMWFAPSEDRPLFAFAGLWTPWRGVRGPKSASAEGRQRAKCDAPRAQCFPGGCDAQRKAPRAQLTNAGQSLRAPGWGARKGRAVVAILLGDCVAFMEVVRRCRGRYARGSRSPPLSRHCGFAVAALRSGGCGTRRGSGRPLEELRGPDPQRREQPKLVL